jgi:O-acetyl-ADP-ribose deacetylase (regulator of RNase III)
MIHYRIGDATRPAGVGPQIIAHVCNSVGGWGRGFVLAISKRWGAPEATYRSWFRCKDHPDHGRFYLGAVQFVLVQKDLIVANMIAQVGYGKENRGAHKSSDLDASIPLRYPALLDCLRQVGLYARKTGASVHMPRIGCGLAGGTWDRVEPIVAQTLEGIEVYVYDLEK